MVNDFCAQFTFPEIDALWTLSMENDSKSLFSSEDTFQ